MKQKIVILGAGKVAHSLVPALVKSCYNVDSIHSRKLLSAKKLAQKYIIKHFTNLFEEIPRDTKIFLLTIPDSEIKKTSEKLSKLNFDFNKSYFIHFSGVEDITVLKALKNKGASTGSIHLMQTFPTKRISSLKEVHAAIESNDDLSYKLLMNISKDLHLNPFKLNSKDKVFYHLAGIMGSNFLAGNLYQSEKLLTLCGIDKNKSFEILKSTIFTTLENTRNYGAANSLSGPIDRGDIKTIKKHIAALKKLAKRKDIKFEVSNLLKSYLVQSLLLLNLVEIKMGTLTANHLKIKNVLSEELKR